MPAEDLPDWHRSYVHAVDPQNPRTALGAMAGYLLWDLQLAAITNWPNLVEEFAGTNCIVDQFITARQLQGSALDKLLRHNHALALSGPQSNIYQRTRALVIELLKDYWLSETNPCGRLPPAAGMAALTAAFCDPMSVLPGPAPPGRAMPVPVSCWPPGPRWHTRRCRRRWTSSHPRSCRWRRN